ncbi:hypothetical protein HUJ04_012449 [Dendroctonus ponderosae]|nr:hypothetical protein HUJ04_012449 [Dendroctonus ponderosae]
MDVDGLDLQKPASDSSLLNDTTENSSVTKNAASLSDSKEFESISNEIHSSDSPEILQNEARGPPNGEPETFSSMEVDNGPTESQIHKDNMPPHLESNENIAENCERDTEIMESENVETTSSIDPIESNPIDCASKSTSEIESQDPPDVNSDPISTLSTFPSDEPSDEKVSPCEDLNSEPKMLPTESVIVFDSTSDRDSICPDIGKLTSADEDFSLVNELPVHKSSDTQCDSPLADTLNIPEHYENVEKDLDQDQEQDSTLNDVEMDPIKIISEDDMDISCRDNVPATDSPEQSNDPENVLNDPELHSISVADIQGPTEQSSEETTNLLTDEDSQSSPTASIDTIKGSVEENPLMEKDRIEFAEVNFDANDNEKEMDKATSNSRDSDIDAINTETDVLDSIDNSQGSDEAITIIPDSEREITEAEKEAASSLPTLKDISDQTSSTPEEETDEPETSSEDEIKIYRHEKDSEQFCCECKETKTAKYHFSGTDSEISYICTETCLTQFKNTATKKVTMIVDEAQGLRVKNFMEGPNKEPPSLSFIRKCASCSKVTDDIESNLTWEIMDFCNEFCLSKYQKMIGSKCASCAGDVKSTSLGKYCVRFGNDIRQFCTSTCLEQYKQGLKVCSYCQQDMSNGPDGFLAPVGEKGQFKDFCSKVCMDKYDIMTNDRPPNVESGTICSVCKEEKVISIEFEHNNNLNYFCGEPCFVAFSFVNKISPAKCAMCRRHFNKSVLEQHTMYYDNIQYSFCSNSCENIYIIAHRKIVPCSWCKVKKYNFDMIKKYSTTSPVINMCSINCLNMYQVSINAVNAKPTPCNFCKKQANPAYHLTMSDASMRNFCSYMCVMNFQNQFPKQLSFNNVVDPIPAGTPQKSKKAIVSDTATTTGSENISQLPIISNVQSLAITNGSVTPPLLPPGLTPLSSTRLTRSKSTTSTPQQQTSSVQGVQNLDLPVQVQVKQHFIIKEKPCPAQRNVGVMCQPKQAVKGLQITPTTKDACIQTDNEDIKKIIIPVPVPIYVPAPCHMFSTPVPFPVPFPLPIPIPIFVPTTRNSAAGIMKEIKKIQVKIPTDPYEAELLMMAEMVAEEKKEDHTDSESDIDDTVGETGGEYSPEPVDTNNTFGDDMLQIALKMATELDEPAVDLEGALTANTITAPQGGHPPDTHSQEENVDDPQPIHSHLLERSPLRGRKRTMRGSPRGQQSKRGRRMSHHQVDMPMIQPAQPPPPPEPQEKPDANMCLKYTFGVNAWKQWVTTKNAELEKSSRRVKLFKTEILQLTADELNYSLCLFVKEVRKPNGQEYAPDTIYYLCLGIQQYLFENGRIDNIFCDPYYEKFTDCLDEVAKKFSVLYNDSHYIVTRVEEEHLWESKQLGAHSPHVLLSTLMFFNTKHFNLTTVDEHMQLSFSHIMKHWKRNPNQPGASKLPGSRNVLLRFYPPQSALQNNQRKKKVYEQQENEENPLRCPVKLYEFYLSKCPESVKTRNDVFYLQPERSCVPDSPVWYSTMPLPKEALEKMLHRVKMVKEINVALLTS